MRESRFAFFAMIVVAALLGSSVVANATVDNGIEVLAEQNGIEVLGIEVLGIEVLGIEVLGIEVLGIEVLGIEVLGIEVLDSGASSIALRVPNVPAGSFAAALMVVNGEEQIVDATPIDPNTGHTMVSFPASVPGSQIRIYAPSGEVLGGTDYVEGVDFD